MKKFIYLIITSFVAFTGFAGCGLFKAEPKAVVSVYFDENISEGRIQEIGEEIESQEGVDHIEFVTAEEAWEDFKSQYFEEYDYLAEGFKDDNPLANCDSYSVYMLDTSKQDMLVSYLESIDGVRQVNRSTETD